MTSTSRTTAGRTRFGRWRAVIAFGAVAALVPLGIVGARPFRAQAEQNNPAIHYVIDVSGSMAGERLTNAVAAIKQSAASVPNTTALGLRSYAGGCDQSTTAAAVPIGTNNDAAIDTAADHLVAGGGTPTTAALGEGFKELQAYPTTGPKRLVLLTDGDTQCGITICDYVKQNLPAGVQLQLYTVGLQVSDTAATDLTCAAQSTGGSYIPAQQPSDLADALAQATTGSRSCASSGAGGWRMSAHISDNDGLVLDESAFGGRVFAKQISVPYLEGIYRHNGVPGLVSLIELTPTRDKAHPAPDGEPLRGSTLQSFQCGQDGGDIYAKAVYAVDDFVAETNTTGPLTVTQEYRFRGIDAAHPCEPTEKLSCARFWPSLSYHYAGSTDCPRRNTRTCTQFTALRTVQRMAFRPDDKLGGGIDAYRDSPTIDKDPGTLKTKGSRGAMRYEDADEAIRNGSRGDWDSIHQAPGPKTSGPGVLSPGCGECVHMHWAWTSFLIDAHKRQRWSDGKPEIPDGSTQSADFGVVRQQDGEEDPYVKGWRSLIGKKKNAASELTGHTPIIFWEMTSYGKDDATFPILNNYRHGGNGAIFFGG
ncbi:VWA domain-containing protein [Actinoplanes sp. L3-i22]|uniref:vWA domain-containing protein n=1 Tax=Actinoplanes sp. L3-i22 TaxID=2836373 RepID=UPI001C7834C4|nr:VWA domain-containing protein [Actinoplanes sp. L3-i22]BCY09235.1 hypothetical protein L3i22_043230 [Actinoplanes sp. L3-i22]